jgi:hypothetical protein
MNKAHNLVEEVIAPEALELCTQFREDVQEMTEQLIRQGQRLIELKEKKTLDPGETRLQKACEVTYLQQRWLLRAGGA